LVFGPKSQYNIGFQPTINILLYQNICFAAKTISDISLAICAVS